MANLSEMSENQIIGMLSQYEEAGNNGLLEMENLVEMPTETLTTLSVALLFLSRRLPEGTVELRFPWLSKNVESEYRRRQGNFFGN